MAGGRFSESVNFILAALIIIAFSYALGTFAVDVIGLAEHGSPNANFDFSYDGDRLTITHETGSVIDAENLIVEVMAGDRGTATFRWSDAGEDQVRSGDAVNIGEPGTNATFTLEFSLQPGDTVRVVWRDSDGEVAQGAFVVPENGSNS